MSLDFSTPGSKKPSKRLITLIEQYMRKDKYGEKHGIPEETAGESSKVSPGKGKGKEDEERRIPRIRVSTPSDGSPGSEESYNPDPSYLYPGREERDKLPFDTSSASEFESLTEEEMKAFRTAITEMSGKNLRTLRDHEKEIR